jgi:hypothetical protein
MNNPFRYPAKQWSKAKQEARDALIEVARGQTVIAYADLAVEIHAIPLDARDLRLNTLLGQISEEEDAANRGMLSVLVVHKKGDKRPGGGFFELADELGYAFTDRDEFWIKMLNNVYWYWRNK